MTKLRIGVLTDERYETILALQRGNFKVPVKERSPEQANGINIHRRWRRHFGVTHTDSEFKLTYDKKFIVKKSQLKEIILKRFSDSYGTGVRAIYHRLKEKYHGVSERMIQTVLDSSSQYHKERPRFLNKPRIKTVKADFPNQRWQIDLIDMKNDSVLVKNKTYTFILQVVDVYSRLLMSRPLMNKSSSTVARALEDLLLEHDAPKIIQCDNGSEFKGEVDKLCKRYSIKVICSSPYHPQSQGKCERTNRTLKTKIRFAMEKHSGFNWVKGLTRIVYNINKTPKSILGILTPFEVYYARGRASSKKTYKQLKKLERQWQRKTSSRVSESVSSYYINEKVLIRYPYRRSRIPRRRFVIEGIILQKRTDGYKYLVKYIKPTGGETSDWIGVEHITSRTVKKEKSRLKVFNSCRKPINRPDKSKRTRRRQHKTRYYIELTHDNKLETLNSAFHHKAKVVLDPLPNGNCQFEAIAHQLTCLGVYMDHAALRSMAVRHLIENRDTYMHFVHEDFGNYISQMQLDGTYGDHLTLLSLMRELNLQAVVLSTAGTDHTVVISNDGFHHVDLNTITLGHFTENHGMHYVSIELDHDELNSCIKDLPYFNEIPDKVKKVLQNSPKDKTEQNNILEDNEVNQENKEVNRDDNEEYLDINEVDREINEPIIDSYSVLRYQVEQIRNKKKHRNTSRINILNLPPEILEFIFNICITNFPYMRYILRDVNPYIRNIVLSLKIPLPQLYIPSRIMGNVPGRLSVRKVLRRAGSGSGLVIAVKKIINHRRWINAWLEVRYDGLGWYKIVNISI